jgi:uncharacterized protein
MTSAQHNAASWWIEQLGLEPHPEGGYFRETFRADESLAGDALPARYGGAARAISTSIYYLLERGQRSRLHRLASDEMWHFHAGDPVTVHLLDDAAGYRAPVVGLGLEGGETPQLHIPRGTWFGATLDHSDAAEAAGFVLVGCTVAPGFDFDDFEVAEREPILRGYPQHADVLSRLV